MAKLSSQATLFGLDLAPLWAQVRQLIAQLPLLRRLERWVRPSVVLWITDTAPQAAAQQPPSSIALLRASQWLGLGAASAAPPTGAALLLDADLVLHRRLHLPMLGGADLDAAVQLQAITLSPFAVQDLLCAYDSHPASRGGLDVDLVLASRQMVENARQQAVNSYQLKSLPEVWAPIPGRSPMLCPGWGEQPRLRQERRRRLGLVAGVLGVLALAGLLALTPSLKLRLQTQQALMQTAALAQQTRDVAAQRQRLMAQAQELHALQPQLEQQIDHLRVLAVLTRVLPDDTATQRIVIEGTHLSLQGLSANAVQVQHLLGQEPGFHSVRMPSAITRDNHSKLENFAIEADLDPRVFAVWPLPAASAAAEQP